MDGNFPVSPDARQRVRDDGVSQTFREAVNGFLADALTDALRQAGRETVGLKSPRWASKLWQEKLHARGWAAPSWPVEHGGTGWSAAEQLYFETACADQDAPIVYSSGIRTIGPLIMAMGREDQKQAYLPAILTGAHEWCQGYSEPQAGSDLTALQLRAERDGDDFVLNGSKIWTSLTNDATHMFLLARCDPAASGKDGLVFLLVEMDRPGIEVRPIRFIDGTCETCQVFFTDVRTPASDRIGEIGDGWTAARTLMTIARSNNTTPGRLRRALRAAKHSLGADGADPALAARLAALEMRLDTFEALSARKASEAQGAVTPLTASMLKVLATELQQAINAAALDGGPGAPLALPRYLANRAATIYSGTSEIHRNTMARLIGCA
ncbi:acyl-CoA dehydrogenase family protein [Henriciella aquimarina]|uniref:acyl-CoA dehydrogenase family protein n=1 Tax=Henriciella aquimarina TaxID=545261 RepID=UPI0009FD0858|nr:acyl-CoA dehydrogenase family protein [Henriciella aquimarina]